jgi:hypothetical protein
MAMDPRDLCFSAAGQRVVVELKEIPSLFRGSWARPFHSANYHFLRIQFSFNTHYPPSVDAIAPVRTGEVRRASPTQATTDPSLANSC